MGTHTTNSLFWRLRSDQTNTFARNLGVVFNDNYLTIMVVTNRSSSVNGVYSAGEASPIATVLCRQMASTVWLTLE
jgi:thioredoxin reductase